MVSKQNVGNAGEYFVSALLSAHDFVVTVTLGRNEGYDLLVANPKGHPLKIQVKAGYSSKVKKFPMSSKADTIIDEDFFYVFVRLNEFITMPDYWVVPAKVVAEFVKNDYDYYASLPRRDGTPRKESSMRSFHLIQKKGHPDDWENQLKKYNSNIQLLTDF